MNSLKISATALTVAALCASSAFAATTTTTTTTRTVTSTHVSKPGVSFVMGKPTDAAALPDITAWMLRYDPAAIKALDTAKTVTVFSYHSAWVGADAMKAAGLLRTDRKSIDALRTALAKDPRADKLLKANHIKPGQVVGVFDVKDKVSLYIL